MFSRVFFAAILAGLIAGIVLATLQHFRTTALIIAAEQIVDGDVTPSKKADTHSQETKKPEGSVKNPTEKEHHAGTWMPKDGFERTAYSYLSAIVLACGLSLAMIAISLLTGISVTPQNGALWGLVGFATASLAPAAGLPPELPGMPYIDLEARQIWWWATVFASVGGAVALAKSDNVFIKIAAVALIAAPHLIGAPMADDHDTDVPAHIIQVYVANVLFIMAIVWTTIGVALGYAMNQFGINTTTSEA